jgi:translocation protein SEC63
MGSEEKYDDLAFVYVLIAFVVILLIPTSFSYFKKWKRILTLKPSGICNCSGCVKKSKRIIEKEKEITFTSILKFSLYVVLWVALLRLLQTVATSERQVETFFDPYQILGLDTGATKEEIKKAFRTLSLRYHPDKSTEPDAENKYIAIQKAYETLTDDVVRERWEKYGNPDGPQSFSIGLALPSFLVNAQNKGFVLALYFLLIV